MQTVTGRISRLLHDRSGDVNGLVLDTGVGVLFPSDVAPLVLAIATIDSRVEVSGRIHSGSSHDAYIDAAKIANLDSKRTASLYVLSTPQRPEVFAGHQTAPSTAAPLAPPSTVDSESAHAQHAKLPSSITHSDVIDEIELAYDRLHRTQAMLAYMKMMKQGKNTAGQYLDEAKHTYVQALSRYEARDFEGAREFAAASSGLSRSVEILISRTFHSNNDYPKLVPPPPERLPARGDTQTVRNDLDRVEHLLARVRWVTENGTVPSEDRVQIERLSSWSERLCRWAQRLFESGAMEDAIEFAQAAHAAVCSAEHLCRKCYVTRSAEPHASPVSG
jgi:hypothetical protein